MRREALIAMMCVGLIGCQVSTAPQTVAELDRRHGVMMTRAGWRGQYTLYLLPANPKGQWRVVQTAHLNKDDPLGFRQRESGPVAIAGDLEVPLETGEYRWVMRADAGQVNGWATAGVVVLAVAVVGGILLAIFVASVNQSLKGHVHIPVAE